jgi:hypothetical protein
MKRSAGFERTGAVRMSATLTDLHWHGAILAARFGRSLALCGGAAEKSTVS